MTDAAHYEGEYGVEQEVLPDDGFDDVPVTIEERARTMGWKPLGEHKGPRHTWLNAEDFVRRGEEELPILRDQNRRLSEKVARNDRQIADLTRSVGEQRQAVQAAMDLARRANEQGYNRALAEIKARAREAAETGDVTAYDQAQEEQAALEATRAEVEARPAAPAPATPPRDGPPAVDPEITAFVEANPWFGNDAQLRASMIAEHTREKNLRPGTSLRAQLAAAKARVVTDFPEKFGRQPAPEPEPEPLLEAEDEYEDEEIEQPVAQPPAPRPRPQRAPVLTPGGAPGGPRRASASPIDAIPDRDERAQARAAFQSMRNQDEGFTEAEYMRIYNDPHLDVLDLRRERQAAPPQRATRR